MMLIMSIVCLLVTLSRYIWLDELLCSVNYVQPFVFEILEENVHDVAVFREDWLFPGWFQMMSVVSWVVSYSFL